jgi:hypothetical protein
MVLKCVERGREGYEGREVGRADKRSTKQLRNREGKMWNRKRETAFRAVGK